MEIGGYCTNRPLIPLGYIYGKIRENENGILIADDIIWKRFICWIFMLGKSIWEVHDPEHEVQGIDDSNVGLCCAMGMAEGNI